ncbi:MAG TPA: HD domain-containing phosphohydrolase, partial [Anaerolineaceae bacterium]|nr:HD domain-containing phosphohydrolase [Anaerolineaceae bacterium]
IPYDSTSVMLLDSGQPKVYASRGGHIVREDPFYTRLKTSDHIQKILEHGVPVRIANTHESTSWLKRSEQSLARSWMGIPLIVKDEIIGLINLDKNEPDFYTDEDTQLALAFANQAASAIGNARLFSMERAHAYELEVIANTSNSVRDEQNRSAILSILIDQVLSSTKAAGAIVATGSDHSRTGVFEQGRGTWESFTGQESPALTRKITRYSPEGASHEDGRPLPNPPEPLNQGMEVVGVPLLAQKHVVGTVFIGRKTPFSDSEIHLVQSICDIAASAIHRVTLFEQTELNVRRLSTLRTIDMAITASINVRLTLDILIEEAVANLKLEATDILLLNSSTRSLDWAAGQGFHHVGLSRFKTTLPDPFSLDKRTPVARAIYDRRPIFVEEIREIDPIRGPILAKEGFVSAYIVPFTVKGQVKGVMEIFSRSQILAEADWLGFLEALAGQAAIAIDNAELFNHLERSNQELSLAYDATIEGWSRALDLRDQETEGHSQRVTDLSMRLAREMDLRNEALVHIRRGALLHDIGKMGIPDEILLKPGALNENEWQIMRQHPVLAYQLLSSISFLQPALDIPYCHHEKWDGSGYPRGLSGHEIPQAARIFAIVDVWDALRSDRPYRQAWSREAAIDYLRSQSGKHFDPAILALFLKLIEGKGTNQD